MEMMCANTFAVKVNGKPLHLVEPSVLRFKVREQISNPRCMHFRRTYPGWQNQGRAQN